MMGQTKIDDFEIPLRIGLGTDSSYDCCRLFLSDCLK